MRLFVLAEIVTFTLAVISIVGDTFIIIPGFGWVACGLLALALDQGARDLPPPRR